MEYEKQNMITFIDVSNGEVDKFYSNAHRSTEREKIFEKAMNDNEFKTVKLRKGLSLERFKEEQPWPWMIKRIESLCSTKFDEFRAAESKVLIRRAVRNAESVNEEVDII